MHPMRVLFLIPKNNPPQLTGNYSKQFKEFIELCLNKEPENVSNSFCRFCIVNIVSMMIFTRLNYHKWNISKINIVLWITRCLRGCLSLTRNVKVKLFIFYHLPSKSPSLVINNHKARTVCTAIKTSLKCFLSARAKPSASTFYQKFHIHNSLLTYS